ncbi:MAG TPA: transposase [Candidatus Agrococcus pullicola]|uniref:Transposase n=1 Tax=Candidatus Agrococcus pullicola TaxID=2838429 RepID=A0A9D2CB96_9MICO|nr:transposase [Candidatus Agrococcus pullicola]
MVRPSKYPRELRGRAVRMVTESLANDDYPSEFEAIRTIAVNLGIGSPETLRKWVRRAEIDGGQRPGGLHELVTVSVRPRGPGYWS